MILPKLSGIFHIVALDCHAILFIVDYIVDIVLTEEYIALDR